MAQNTIPTPGDPDFDWSHYQQYRAATPDPVEEAKRTLAQTDQKFPELMPQHGNALAQNIRAQAPGAYDDMSDAELVGAYTAKHPIKPEYGQMDAFGKTFDTLGHVAAENPNKVQILGGLLGGLPGFMGAHMMTDASQNYVKDPSKPDPLGDLVGTAEAGAGAYAGGKLLGWLPGAASRTGAAIEAAGDRIPWQATKSKLITTGLGKAVRGIGDAGQAAGEFLTKDRALPFGLGETDPTVPSEAFHDGSYQGPQSGTNAVKWMQANEVPYRGASSLDTPPQTYSSPAHMGVRSSAPSLEGQPVEPRNLFTPDKSADDIMENSVNGGVDVDSPLVRAAKAAQAMRTSSATSGSEGTLPDPINLQRGGNGSTGNVTDSADHLGQNVVQPLSQRQAYNPSDRYYQSAGAEAPPDAQVLSAPPMNTSPAARAQAVTDNLTRNAPYGEGSLMPSNMTPTEYRDPAEEFAAKMNLPSTADVNASVDARNRTGSWAAFSPTSNDPFTRYTNRLVNMDAPDGPGRLSEILKALRTP